ncbi:DNA invertase Pin-like site-specific DNA recombinase [Lachnotalea glycerini]|uniref:DNA invertase Pin-like site-specific DNA recombinase n=1 Tax=Lachnotalea glycerini TaxID=1763509 RepID=A0A318EP69_9FIRM|nr:recombinase family protein [Lachnotalea glycerini]PXV90330.1 DNA invertase Pin-like site-specific DNA recombinase [Lachnotalea glycerini]
MARVANRQCITKTASKNKVWYVAFYIRLSREDKRGKDESESITNQRLILTDFLEQQDDDDEYVFIDEYVDDGISGTTDEERENFQRLLADIQKRKINCIIVKNLARSFRNNGDQSYYLGDWFPRNNVRFISLYQQPIDTYKDPQNAQNIAVPVQGVLNEEHARGTSESVRRTFDKKREKGLHIGSFAAYGYQKNPEDKNALIIDEEAAENVKCIFAWFLEGMSKNAIVRKLNDSGILCPAAYKKSKGMKYKNPNFIDGNPLWCAMSVSNLLKNRIYAGDMVQGRYRVMSYKIHVQKTVPEDEWFIVENTHEPIISRKDFAKVQELLKKDTRTAPKQKTLYLFSGFLRCADCGKAMTRSKVRGNVYYYCRTYKDQSKTACTKHTIKHNHLEQAVLYAIKQQVYIAVSLSEMVSRINTAPLQKSQSIRLNELITSKEKELSKISSYKQSIYQDWKDGEITHKDYCQMKEDYERQIEVIGEVIGNLQEEKAELENGIDIENPSLSAFLKYENINKLTRDILIELVDTIKVYENGNISVRFKFANEYREVAEYIEVNNHKNTV